MDMDLHGRRWRRRSLSGSVHFEAVSRLVDGRAEVGGARRAHAEARVALENDPADRAKSIATGTCAWVDQNAMAETPVVGRVIRGVSSPV